MMNKEEIKTNYGEIQIGNKLYYGLSNELVECFNQLQQENKKYKEVIDSIEKYIKKETRIYGLSMSIELGTHFDNILGILKEVE